MGQSVASDDLLLRGFGFQLTEIIGGGRGIRTPKGLAARWISSPLPCQLRLALLLPNILSYYHDLTHRATGRFLRLESTIVRENSQFVRVGRQSRFGVCQGCEYVIRLDDSVAPEHR